MLDEKDYTNKDVTQALHIIAGALRETEFQLEQQYKALRSMVDAIEKINVKITTLSERCLGETKI
jgi:hypothetical protein